MRRVGIRELRQDASRLLDRVKSGETLEVTEHGRPVALLVPLPPAADVVQRLVVEGRATPAEGSLLELPPPARPKRGRPLPSEALARARADER